MHHQPTSVKKAVKVSYQGETKRLKLSGDYQELIERTRAAFKSMPAEFKYFYLDEDNEIISISAQSDFTEALEIEDLASLRLTVAQSAHDARKQLMTQLEEARPLAESLNSSQIISAVGGFGQGRIMRDNFMGESDFDSVSHAELGQSIFDRRNTMQPSTAHTDAKHEIAVGSDAAMPTGIDFGTVTHPVVRAETGCNTARVKTKSVMIDTCVQMQDSSAQAMTNTKDMGCDGIVTHMQSQASQMEVQMKEVDVTCDLLIPSDDENDANIEEVTCIKCNGTQMNKKGLPCRKCNGRGTLISRELSEVAAMVRQEVQEYCYQSFHKMFTEYLTEKKVKQDSTVHNKVICDGCDANPMTGIRYMCSVCADTDFCEACERNGIHPQHALLKIRNESQAPNKLICQYKNIAAPAQPVPQWERRPANTEPAKNVRFSARFVKESFPDKYQVLSGVTFCKSWWMRNDGETAWPAGTQLVQTSGDNIGANLVTLINEVAAGATFEISVQCKAPEQEGRYTAFFRLQTGRIKFGHKVSADILVVKPKADEPMDETDVIVSEIMAEPAQQTIHPEPVVMEAQETVEVACDKEMAEPEQVYHEQSAFEAEPMVVEQPMEQPVQQPSALMQSTISIAKKSPKQVYFELVDAEDSEQLKSDMKALYDFGFTNFGVNKMLMLKHRNINVVADTLMVGALSESQFDAVVNN